jgi:putative effector of murein hydrolase LrgA (UPF0299 family)
MNFKKSIFAVILLFLVSNILTTGWYMFTDDENFVAFRRDEVNYVGLIINHLIFVICFVYLFPYLVRGKNNKLHAFWFGVVLAVIMFIPTGLVVRSIWKVDFNSIFLMNTLAHLIIGGVLGIISSLIYNYKKNETN